MKRAVLADVGPLYAAADAGDAHHQQAMQQLQKLARDRRESFGREVRERALHTCAICARVELAETNHACAVGNRRT